MPIGSSTRLLDALLDAPAMGLLGVRHMRSGAPAARRRQLAARKLPDDKAEHQAQTFDDLPLSEGTRLALRDVFQYDAMSDVQRQVLPAALSQSCDFVVRAHTGTGKTLAFLIPAVEAALSAPRGRGVCVLALAPTRELAIQIAKEAEMLASRHSFKVVTLIGGTPPRQDQLAIRRMKPRIVVATPGRLLEHLERTYLFPTLFENLQTLILDEVDRLLSMGFLDAVKEILAYMPAQRRSMLFSATVSQDVLDITARMCRANYAYIDCVGEEETPTALSVEQSFVVCHGHQSFAALYNLVMNEMARDKDTHKVLVFFPTARLTAFMAQLFRQQLHLGVLEIHRRRDAEARLATQARFQAAQSAVMFSSDVSARGMDYPNVTLVIQFGAPSTRELYIHRVGRTARAGKSGRAVLLLGELEQAFLKAVEDLPLAPHEDADSLNRVNELLVRATTTWLTSATLRDSATAAFASLLVHYKATHRVLHMVDDDVVQAASDLLLGCGLVDQPVISKRLAIMLGMENHPYLKCSHRLGEEELPDNDPVPGEPEKPPRFGAGVLGTQDREANAPSRRVPWRDS